MKMDIEKMEQASWDGNCKRKKDNYKQIPLLGEVNEPAECVVLLKRLNQMISTLWKLSDDYYRSYIFNNSTVIDEELEKNGFDDDYFEELAYRMEKLRGILYRDALDYDTLYQAMQDEVMVYEAYWHSHFRQRTEELEYENKKLKEKENGNA
jgi:hypothetical protein